MSAFRLVVGNLNYSSWSIRAWLMAGLTNAPFELTKIHLRDADKKQQILAHSPSGLVPALVIDEHVVWDTLAIGETLAELYPEAGLLPVDQFARAHARSVMAEMHSGFMAVRREWPMNFRNRTAARPANDEMRADIARIEEIWQNCRERNNDDGPYLFGQFSMADAMYAPVVSRFVTYGAELGDEAREYCQAVLDHPLCQEWAKLATAEEWVIEEYDFD